MALLLGLSLFVVGVGILGAKFAGWMAAYGMIMLLLALVQATTFAAIGYVIELLAKIEWNTRPNADGSGYVGSPSSGAMPLMADKQYFLSEKGRVTGPLNAGELLALYRDGRISIAAQISVEEGGQRRLLKNLSEIGL